MENAMESSDQNPARPSCELVLQTIAMPKDANPSGDIFGGWLLSQMDLAGGIIAGQRAHGRVVTIAIEGMKFLLPVFVGDLVSCYGAVTRVGKTSLSVKVETWVRRGSTSPKHKVTEGLFTFVAVDKDRQKREIPSYIG